MFKKRWDALASSLLEHSRLLDALDRRSEKMETILMVREPSSAVAAEAYDGLRRQVVSVMTERLSHLSHLVQIDAALAHGAHPRELASLLDGWFEEAGLRRVTETRSGDIDLLYQLVEDHGGLLEVIEPAYVDERTHRVIRQGRARRVPVAPAIPDAPAQAGAQPAETGYVTSQGEPAGEAGIL